VSSEFPAFACLRRIYAGVKGGEQLMAVKKAAKKAAKKKTAKKK